MAKPTIVTRATKGSALTWTEGDANFTNLQNATLTIEAGTGGTDVVSDLNGTITLVAGTNVTLSGDNTAKTVTINSTASGGATTLNGLDDVVTPTPATGEVLQYDGTNWVDVAPSTLTVGTATTATTATNINIASTDGNASDTTMSVVLAAIQATGGQAPHIDAGLTYNASTNVLTASGFAGALNGTVGATTPAAGTFTNITSTTSNATINLSPVGASGAVTISPSVNTGAAVTISPTAGYVIISSNASNQGSINNMAIGNTGAASGRFTTVQSTVATGTAPFTVASTTNVANLNASSLNGATFAAPGAIGGTTASTGAFTNLSSTGTLTFKNPIEAIFNIGTTGGTIAPDPANGSVQQITLNSALTLNAFTNPTAGESLTLIIYGGTAYTSITSTMKFAGGVKTLTGTAGCIDILSIYFDGTNYFASLGKGYA